MYQAAVLSANSRSSRQTTAREQDTTNSPSRLDTFEGKWTDKAVGKKRLTAQKKHKQGDAGSVHGTELN